MMRTFVAVEISESQIINNIIQFQKNFKINAKPVESQNLHFTIQFIGEISEKEVDSIKDKLSTISFLPFNVTLKGIGVFPKPSFPRVIWIGTDKEGGEKLRKLAANIQDELESIGFKADKPFEPHITIFRVKNKITNITKELERFVDVEFGLQTINEFKFKKSELTTQGPIYSDLLVIKA